MNESFSIFQNTVKVFQRHLDFYRFYIKSGFMLWNCGTFQFDLTERTLIMGILNVTPDSFSDGGKFEDPADAAKHAIKMHRQGADIIDIGGESTRPGAKSVSQEVELSRVIPVIEKISAMDSGVCISIDTQKAEVARQALAAGASIVNDVSGLTSDPEIIDVVSVSDCGIVIMHMQGNPETMQQRPEYENVIEEILDFFKARLKDCLSRQIDSQRIALDPGIGFGKRLEDNLQIINRVDQFLSLNLPILIGASRKSVIEKAIDLAIEDRLEASLALGVITAFKGTSILRVHDVLESRRAIDMCDAIKNEKRLKPVLEKVV